MVLLLKLIIETAIWKQGGKSKRDRELKGECESGSSVFQVDRTPYLLRKSSRALCHLFICVAKHISRVQHWLVSMYYETNDCVSESDLAFGSTATLCWPARPRGTCPYCRDLRGDLLSGNKAEEIRLQPHRKILADNVQPRSHWQANTVLSHWK